MKPWIKTTTSSWWEDLLGMGYYRSEIDTEHPEFIKQVLIPMIEKRLNLVKQ